jgi:putative transcriptional regulator
MKKSIGKELLEGMRELTEALESRPDISDEFTVRRMKLDLQPEAYSPAKVIETRKLLGASQVVFATFIGVNVKTLQAWEQGANPAAGAAARLMDEIRFNPVFFRERLRSLAKPKVMGKGKKAKAK